MLRKILLVAIVGAMGAATVVSVARAQGTDTDQRKALAPGLCAICGPFDNQKKCTCVFGET